MGARSTPTAVLKGSSLITRDPESLSQGSQSSGVKSHKENTGLPGGWQHHSLGDFCKTIKPWTWKAVTSEFEFQLYHLLAMWPGASCLISLSFLTCKLGIIIASTPEGCGEDYTDNAQKAFRRALGTHKVTRGMRAVVTII